MKSAPVSRAFIWQTNRMSLFRHLIGFLTVLKGTPYAFSSASPHGRRVLFAFIPRDAAAPSGAESDRRKSGRSHQLPCQNSTVATPSSLRPLPNQDASSPRTCTRRIPNCRSAELYSSRLARVPRMGFCSIIDYRAYKSRRRQQI